MTLGNALDSIWQSYLGAIDCFKIANRCVSQGDVRYLKKTNFIYEKASDAESKIMAGRNNADDFVILSLWAVFERVLLEEIQRESKKMLNDADSTFTSKIYNKIENEIEYWRFDDVLDLFKERVDPCLIGNAKQIKKYRDWIAHRNPKKPPTINVTPEVAYKVLTSITQTLASSSV
jgi:hypothetical protein